MHIRYTGFLTSVIFSGIIIGTPFTVQVLAVNKNHIEATASTNNQNIQETDEKLGCDDKTPEQTAQDIKSGREKENNSDDQLCPTETPVPTYLPKLTPSPTQVPILQIVNNSNTNIILNGNSNSNSQSQVVTQDANPDISITNDNNPSFTNNNTITITTN